MLAGPLQGPGRIRPGARLHLRERHQGSSRHSEGADFDEARRIAVNVAELPELLGALAKTEEASP